MSNLQQLRLEVRRIEVTQHVLGAVDTNTPLYKNYGSRIAVAATFRNR